jgi:hypothetical protein
MLSGGTVKAHFDVQMPAVDKHTVSIDMAMCGS